MSAGLEAAGSLATDRRPGSGRRIRVGIIGATGYVGAELVRLLARHPAVEIVGLQARGREDQPIGATHAHLATTGLSVDEHSYDNDTSLFLCRTIALAEGYESSYITVITNQRASGLAVIVTRASGGV